MDDLDEGIRYLNGIRIWGKDIRWLVWNQLIRLEGRCHIVVEKRFLV